MSKKEKQHRVCGYCGDTGHNVRTCAKKKAADAAAGVKAIPAAPISQTALVVSGQAPIQHLDTRTPEFQEWARQATVDGVTCRLECRTSGAGVTSLRLKYEGAKGAGDVELTVQAASKMYEMLGVALQQYAASTPKPRHLAAAK